MAVSDWQGGGLDASPSNAHILKEAEEPEAAEDGCVGCGNADYAVEFGERFGFLAVSVVSSN